MRSDNKALSTVQDALGLGASKIDTAYTGMNKAIETVNDIKTKLVASNGASAADKEKYDTEIKALQSQLKSYADAATFSGANWLSTDTTTGHTAAGTFDDVKIVSSFNRNAAGTVSLGTIDVKVQDIKLYERLGCHRSRPTVSWTPIASAPPAPAMRPLRPLRPARMLPTDTYTVSTLSVKGFNDAQITKHDHAWLKSALKEMTTAATNLGAAKTRVDRPEGLHHQPDGLDRSWCRSARRRRHEQGIDPPPGPAGSAAARHPGAVDRQRQLAVDPLALPLRSSGRLSPASPPTIQRAALHPKRGPFPFAQGLWRVFPPFRAKFSRLCLS